MSLIKTAVRWRHGTGVLFCLLALFGVLALFQLPLELQPGGDLPEISIATPYLGASPAEVEDLVTRPIEERLEEVQGVQEITSTSNAGISNIAVEFEWGNDIDRSLVDVLNKLQQVEALPAEAAESDVEVVSGSSDAMMWVVLVPKEGFTADDYHYRDLVDDVIVPRFRQVQGVGQFFISGGRAREVEVIVDPKALADRNLTIGDVATTLRNNNRDIRGGPLVLGRREYRVRTVSRIEDVGQLEGFVLRRDESGTVYLGDVAEARMGRAIQDRALTVNNEPAVATGIVRQVGGNVPEISAGIREALVELEERFDREGEGITFEIVYDENDYINESISFVQSNLIIGAVLAALVLLLFLGSLRTVGVIAIAIPTTLITVFIVFYLLDRTLNVISLAGLAFAVGMVVDNAIVVLENVFTHMQQGKTPMRAAIDGTQEVGGAMLASTLTTVAVFAPIVLVTGEAGQLFFDIGIALSASVLFSLFAALTLIPMLAGLFLSRSEAEQMLSGGEYRGGNWLERTVAQTSAVFRHFQGRLEQFILKTVQWSIGRGKLKRRLIVLSLPVVLLFASFLLLPPADYLPEGNRNMIIWLAEPFPGTSIPEGIELSQAPRDFMSAQPEILHTVSVHRSSDRFIGGFLKSEETTSNKLDNLVSLLGAKSSDFPGYRFLVPIRASIFENPGKEFEVQIIGANLEEIDALQEQVRQQISELSGIENVRSNFVTGAPELQIIPNRERLAEVGLSEGEVGEMVQAALGGLRVSEFVDGKRELDVSVELRDTFVETPEQLRQLAIYNGNGQSIQLADVAEVLETTGADAINHVGLERSITLTASVSREAPLGALVDQVEQDILEPLRTALPSGVRVELAGSADVLSETLFQLGSIFLLSLLITYLLLVALYRSFVYPLLIMATVPMGLTGALLCLAIANTIPGVVVPLDMITGLGFVILTGVVVNNAILLIDRALQLQEEGMEYDASLYCAVRDRLRPIFMSAGTSVLGMLPLAVLPGKGAELYQGLGIALTSGLALSTFLTPTVIPALMGLTRDFQSKRNQKVKDYNREKDVELTLGQHQNN
ncbi:efflux RND transporter permease subunit [cf. Phormidesmis sp. LEGE 11477]|uniref:efflux RND transporter permease subunit n=1 Tax=cf. Phormidesmis sp. LEGE 11477 TaxID=1828680 RepID=UPI00187DE7DF|nr:efflux RND transporter permease subunit [cf. Phormidesmis sp. LEGE 11477]MBE9059511.1 efflux RND transporter permease subunit [cf. Phormidesmis sp. LEGE 11477]